MTHERGDGLPTGTATFIRDMTGFKGHARLYRLDPPLEQERWSDDDVEEKESFEYVVSSAATVMLSGDETLIFGADADGEIVNWLDLPGSMKGVYDCDAAIRAAGYEIAPEAVTS